MLRNISMLRLLGWCFCSLLLVAVSAPAADDVANFEFHEIGLWGIDPTLDQVNHLQHYPSAMPGIVDTERSRASDLAKLAPFDLVTFHGEPQKNLEIDLRINPGRFLAHWPAAESKSGRLRWIDLITSTEADPEGRIASVDPKHWFVQARGLDAMHLQIGKRGERFLVYDTEVKLAVPVRLTDGPDTYRIANLSGAPLADVMIIAPGKDGRRVGRLDLLASPPPQPNPGNAKPAENKTADAKPDETAKPAVLERLVVESADNSKPVEKKPDEKKADEKKEQKEAAAKDAAAKQAARAAQAAAAVPAAPAAQAQVGAAEKPGENKPAQPQPTVPAAPPDPGVEVAMSPPLAADSAEWAAVKQSFADGLLKTGLTAKEVDLLVSRASGAIFESDELIVVFRYLPATIEERLPLVAYPAPTKSVRTIVAVVKNIDPKIKDEVQKLVGNLGSASYKEREAAEKRLRELGRLAVPALRDMLKSPDPEIAFRAERILLDQNEKIDGT